MAGLTKGSRETIPGKVHSSHSIVSTGTSVATAVC
jgi:hypothetical protein